MTTMGTPDQYLDLYGNLRRLGTIILSPETASRRLSTIRAAAKRDGLKVVTSRGPSKHLSRSQAKDRPTTVNLVNPSEPSTIIAPDAPCTCMTEDPGDGYGERVVTHSLRCSEHPDYEGD